MSLLSAQVCPSIYYNGYNTIFARFHLANLYEDYPSPAGRYYSLAVVFLKRNLIIEFRTSPTYFSSSRKYQLFPTVYYMSPEIIRQNLVSSKHFQRSENFVIIESSIRSIRNIRQNIGLQHCTISLNYVNIVHQRSHLQNHESVTSFERLLYYSKRNQEYL